MRTSKWTESVDSDVDDLYQHICDMNNAERTLSFGTLVARLKDDDTQAAKKHKYGEMSGE